jgi:metallo-beta-lactamase superfamily
MKKVITILLSIILLLALSACSEKSGDSDSSEAGKFEVIFIDIENSSNTLVHYDGANNDRTWGYQGVKPADCYLIKTGDTEILVDAGFQLQTPTTEIYNQRISKIYKENVLKKIEKYCTDGILEYLVVTHGDFDHIAGVAIDGGVLDYFCGDDKKIENIIDFDSDLVVYLSNPEGNAIYPSGQNRLLQSEIIETYREKRDLLVKTKKTRHIPAAAFFKGTDYLQENVMVNAMPNEYLSQYYRVDKNNQLTDQINTSYLINFYYFSDNEIVHSVCDSVTKQPKADNIKFKSTYKNSNINLGRIKEENERYYYSIDLNGVELRILYNWYYDHFYQHSFNSQDRNNISVCLEVVSGTSKFLTFGDLGSGETGLINYYKDTSILKNVTCFKASHHGSTTNGENSSELYKLMTPKMVIVPGVAQINRDILKENNMTNDSIFGGLSGTAVMKKELFEHVFSGNSATKIYCMQIAQLLKEEQSGTKFALISASFYGDVFLNCDATGYSVDSSYKGNVEGYVSGISDKSKHLIFSNNLDSNILSYCETEHYKSIYENNGKI